MRTSRSSTSRATIWPAATLAKSLIRLSPVGGNWEPRSPFNRRKSAESRPKSTQTAENTPRRAESSSSRLSFSYVTQTLRDARYCLTFDNIGGTIPVSYTTRPFHVSFPSGAQDTPSAIQTAPTAVMWSRRINNIRTLLQRSFHQLTRNQQLTHSLSANMGSVPPKSEAQAKVGVFCCAATLPRPPIVFFYQFAVAGVRNLRIRSFAASRIHPF